MSFDLLSESIRKYIRNKRWESLRPIQTAAINKIITTDSNYILASRTASGKTEAAFLPILSTTNFSANGVQVLYISPLIALINDQFFRIEELCKNLEIKVTKWHGEAKKSLKTNLTKKPNGIVLITPESLEAMLVNAPYNVSLLFGNLKYIVIDEIHTFIGPDRGIQLMSILSRIQQVNKKKIITIGLSATIGDNNYIEAKKITGDIANTKILLDRTKKETIAEFKYYKNSTKELPLELLKNLYLSTKDYKVLIFPNSRGRTEEIAVKLKKISDKVDGHKNYFSHHSSVSKEIREGVELFAKNNKRFNFCISCTSTLELGIDIGTVDKIVQIDSTHSVASLVQRIGRSGRKQGEKSKLDLYATDRWIFLQSLACWELYKDDFLEPIKISEKPYDILLHQMLSIVKQLSGCKKGALVNLLHQNRAFKMIDLAEIQEIIDGAIISDYFEVIQNEIILGIEGENIVNSKDFYSVFTSEQNFKVICSGSTIGEIPYSPQVRIDENILLAAKIWKIKDIDFKGTKIEVIIANDGKKPMFFGKGGAIHPRIREKMLRIIKSSDEFEEINDDCLTILKRIQYDFKNFTIKNFEYERPAIIKDNKLLLYTFTGTKINKTLNFLISLTDMPIIYNDNDSSIELAIELSDFEQLIFKIKHEYNEINNHIQKAIEEENNTLLDFSKWGSYLPLKYQCEIVKDRYFDFEGAISFINNLKMIQMTSMIE